MILDKEIQKKIENALKNYPIKKYKHKDSDHWIKVIDKVVEHFKGEIQGKLIEYNYFECYKLNKQIALLNIERTCYYEKRQDILYYAAFVAQKEGLIEIV